MAAPRNGGWERGRETSTGTADENRNGGHERGRRTRMGTADGNGDAARCGDLDRAGAVSGGCLLQSLRPELPGFEAVHGLPVPLLEVAFKLSLLAAVFESGHRGSGVAEVAGASQEEAIYPAPAVARASRFHVMSRIPVSDVSGADATNSQQDNEWTGE